jgi:micrococcal nuclease
MDSADQLVQQGVAALRGGEREQAQHLLAQALQANPKNEQAWLWLSGTMTDEAERRFCLERVLTINPQNEMAQKGISVLPHVQAKVPELLKAPPKAAPAPTSAEPSPAHAAESPPAAPSPAQKPVQPAQPAQPAPSAGAGETSAAASAGSRLALAGKMKTSSSESLSLPTFTPVDGEEPEEDAPEAEAEPVDKPASPIQRLFARFTRSRKAPAEGSDVPGEEELEDEREEELEEEFEEELEEEEDVAAEGGNRKRLIMAGAAVVLVLALVGAGGFLVLPSLMGDGTTATNPTSTGGATSGSSDTPPAEETSQEAAVSSTETETGGVTTTAELSPTATLNIPPTATSSTSELSGTPTSAVTATSALTATVEPGETTTVTSTATPSTATGGVDANPQPEEPITTTLTTAETVTTVAGTSELTTTATTTVTQTVALTPTEDVPPQELFAGYINSYGYIRTIPRPGTNYIIGLVCPGDNVEVQGQQRGWFRVRLTERKERCAPQGQDEVDLDTEGWLSSNLVAEYAFEPSEDYPSMPTDLPVAAVAQVIDGDAIDVTVSATETVRVRFIGVDTPDKQPPECFQPEAFARTRDLLAGHAVLLEADPNLPDEDEYGQLLRYVWRQDGMLINLELLSGGYGFVFEQYDAVKYQGFFQAALAAAQQETRGLWAPAACNGQRERTN